MTAPGGSRLAKVTPGIALVVSGVALALSPIIESTTASPRGDGDNPRDSLTFLAAETQTFAYTGVLFVVAAIALGVGVLGILRLVQPGGLSLAYLSASVFAVLSSGFIAVAGLLRLNATGTVLYIDNLDPSWGESAYLVVQLAGTQGFIATATIGLSAWLIATAILATRRRLAGLLVIALAPAVIILLLAADALIPALPVPDGFFVVYFLAIVGGLPLGLVILGVTLLFPGVRAQIAVSKR